MALRRKPGAHLRQRSQLINQPAIDVRGLRTLQRTMRKAGVDIADLKDAHQAASQIVADASRDTAPVLTGALRSTVRGNRAAYKAIVRAGNARVPYARPVHWSRWRSRARPFISQAAQATETRWVEEYRKDVEKIVGKVRGI